MIAAFPLQWPAGWPRTDYFKRKHGKFASRGEKTPYGYRPMRDITITEACNRVLDELDRMGIERQDVVISTNVRTRLDGLPRSGERAPDDPGAAVYWQTRRGERRVIAIDAYLHVHDNIAAIAATLDAMRAIERHGGARVMERAFTGFTALPAPSAARAWHEVMEFGGSDIVDLAALTAQYRKLASKRHPDKGGSHAAMAELNAAYEQAKQELSA